MSRRFFTIGTFLAFLAVAAGALGAHAVRDRLTPDMLSIWETAARYGFFHAIALLVIALAGSRWPGREWALAGWLFVGGTLVFSGSLLLLAITGTRWLGALTPLGGVGLLLGWLVAARAAWRRIGPRDGSQESPAGPA